MSAIETPRSRRYFYVHVVPPGLWADRDHTEGLTRRLATQVMDREARAQGYVLDRATVRLGSVLAVLNDGSQADAQLYPPEEPKPATRWPVHYRVGYVADARPALVPLAAEPVALAGLPTWSS